MHKFPSIPNLHKLHQMAVFRVITPFYRCSFDVETTNFLEVFTPNDNVSPLAEKSIKKERISQRDTLLFRNFLFMPTDAEKFVAGLVSLIDNTVNALNGVN